MCGAQDPGIGSVHFNPCFSHTSDAHADSDVEALHLLSKKEEADIRGS